MRYRHRGRLDRDEIEDDREPVVIRDAVAEYIDLIDERRDRLPEINPTKIKAWVPLAPWDRSPE
jgi:hypothetical protein